MLRLLRVARPAAACAGAVLAPLQAALSCAVVLPAAAVSLHARGFRLRGKAKEEHESRPRKPVIDTRPDVPAPAAEPRPSFKEFKAMAQATRRSTNSQHPHSATSLVLAALKTGPKTRKQLFYALNQGAPQHTHEELQRQAIDEAVRMGRIVGKEGSGARMKEIAMLEIPHRYPTGILRNPTHLSRVLRTLTQGKKVWTRPPTSLVDRMGEKELAATAELAARSKITGSHPDALSQKAAKIDGKPNPAWVYVLRDWMEPRAYGSPTLLASRQRKAVSKNKRQIWRRASALSEHWGSGRIGLKKPTKRARFDTLAKKAEIKETHKLVEAVQHYHEVLGVNTAKTEKLWFKHLPTYKERRPAA